jgi:hypothetical protein
MKLYQLHKEGSGSIHFAFRKFKRYYACLNTYQYPEATGWHRMDYKVLYGSRVDSNELETKTKRSLMKKIFIMTNAWFNIKE